MQSLLLVIIAASSIFSACRGADDTLSPTKLPGFEMSLPSWSEQSRGTRWFSDRVVLLDESAQRALFLQWTTANALWTPEELSAALSTGSIAFPGQDVRFGAPAATTIATHAALETTVRVDELSGRISTWYCPEHHRQVMLLTLAPDAVHDAIIASTRCHTEPAPAEDAALFPKFDPPPGMKLDGDPDPSTRTWLSDDGVALVLLAGQPGDSFGDMAAEVMPTTVRQMLTVGGMNEVGAVSDSKVSGDDGTERHIYRTVAKVQGEPVTVHMAAWFCPRVGRTYLAMHVAGTGKLDHFTSEQHLLRATCP